MSAPIAPVPVLREPRALTCRQCELFPPHLSSVYCAVIANTTAANTRACLARGARKREAS